MRKTLREHIRQETLESMNSLYELDYDPRKREYDRTIYYIFKYRLFSTDFLPIYSRYKIKYK